MVSAPAGYGKSTLIRSWLESCDIHVASVSQYDNNCNKKTSDTLQDNLMREFIQEEMLHAKSQPTQKFL
jgi:ATP/maltotriose-dependent transcriptional regulator MalT